MTETDDELHDAADDTEYELILGDDSDDANDADYEFIHDDCEDSDHILSHRHKQNYTILSEADICQRQEESIVKISTVLSISRVAASILLRHYNWSVSKVLDGWFADEEKVRRDAGLLQKPVALPHGRDLTCGICFETYPSDRMSAAACGHGFCGSCWQVGKLNHCYYSEGTHRFRRVRARVKAVSGSQRGHERVSRYRTGSGGCFNRYRPVQSGLELFRLSGFNPGLGCGDSTQIMPQDVGYEYEYHGSFVSDQLCDMEASDGGHVFMGRFETDAYALWMKLELMYQPKTSRNKALLMRKLMNLKLWSGDSVVALLLLSSLPDNWERPVVSLSNSAPDGKLSMSMVNDALFNEETWQKEMGTDYEDEPQALFSDGNRGRSQTRGNGRVGDSHSRLRGRTPFTERSFACFHCHEEGHIKRNCPRYKAEKDKGKSQSQDQTAVIQDSNGYISSAINDGPGCLMLRCPDPSCAAAVGQDIINLLASKDDKAKYNRYFLRSFIEDNWKTKWCPAPGCDYAVDFIVGSGSYDITCPCSYSFCWNCTEEAHRPVDCSTVATWILKNSAESENMNWILANSKPCPKCKRPIEKNQGCMHITCTLPCKFEFCWLCLDPWSDHGEKTGGFYACNRYETAKQEGVLDEAEKRREMAKNSLEKYTHYYERWATNQSSRQKALADLQQMQTMHMGQLNFLSVKDSRLECLMKQSDLRATSSQKLTGPMVVVGRLAKLSEKQCQPESQLKFILEAWLQIVECRRVLKWTYAYGYYLPEYEHAKRQFFEYLQGEAESGLERLHQCVEKELDVYLNDDGQLKDFNVFRTKLAGLTRVNGDRKVNRAGRVNPLPERAGMGEFFITRLGFVTGAREFRNFMVGILYKSTQGFASSSSLSIFETMAKTLLSSPRNPWLRSDSSPHLMPEHCLHWLHFRPGYRRRRNSMVRFGQ
ncbi:hypothetical protein RHSIM_Rhsim05G0164700 [Rhododendron simsii]|uniref:RBR-type E3 ubiquitin transferase n=1 Tax=Rhododendron simsii TaxID=118357 RepID=A0A834H8J2_RHOSS|nr:hypothetical protein RHSIM_Rhsim05G0164700 [Rhododendron simsii]